MGDKSTYECRTIVALNDINQENIGYTSKWNNVQEQILRIGKLALEKMEQRKLQKDKDIPMCKKTKEEPYNHLCAETEELDKHHTPIIHVLQIQSQINGA